MDLTKKLLENKNIDKFDDNEDYKSFSLKNFKVKNNNKTKSNNNSNCNC